MGQGEKERLKTGFSGLGSGLGFLGVSAEQTEGSGSGSGSPDNREAQEQGLLLWSTAPAV